MPDTGADELLLHDLRFFANAIGFSNSAPSGISSEQATRMLQEAESLSRHRTSESSARCLMICALIWEYRSSEWSNLAAILVQIISRLHLAPSLMMVDAGAREGGKFSSLGSLRGQVEATAHMLEGEVQISERTLLLSGFQKRLWDCLQTRDKIGVSAPTSAGKSFVLALHVLNAIQHGGTAVYIVPTVSLIHQVTCDLRRQSQFFQCRDLLVSQTSVHRSNELSTVLILTQERALSSLSLATPNFRPRVFIVDEVQNVERMASDDAERSVTMYDAIRRTVEELHPIQSIICGPKIANILALSRSLLGAGAVAVEDDLPPVLNITYAISGDGRREPHALKQYVQTRATPLSIPLPDFPTGFSFRGRRYGPSIEDAIFRLLGRLGSSPQGGGTLIFSPTSSQAARTANGLTTYRRQKSEDTDADHHLGNELLDALSDYLMVSVSREYDLARSVPFGVGYHHGKMPTHVRACVERAFRMGLLDTISCTTTLMQGVNLPAKILIARNPDMFVRRDVASRSLSNYEFANLRGRTGRLMRDFVGRAIVLHEESFRDNEIEFSVHPEKTVATGYADRFSQGRGEIVEVVSSSSSISADSSVSDIAVYIRQAVLRYGEKAEARLRRVGVFLSAPEMKAVRQAISNLQVPLDICLSCPYWDPIVLDAIHAENSKGHFARMPASPFDKMFFRNVNFNINHMKTVASFYHDKYLATVFSDKHQAALVQMAKKWASEKPLVDVIGGTSVSTEDIDRRVASLSSLVCHGMTKLLKPITMMQNRENPILGFIEMGAYSPTTRRFVERGVPREVAIRLRSSEQNDVVDDNDDVLEARVRSSLSHLTTWEKFQLYDVFPQLESA